MDDRHEAEPDAVDLTPLDPRSEPAHMSVLISGIVADGMAARATRVAAREGGITAQLSRWARPALAAAALVLAVSIPAAIQSGRELRQRVGAAAPATLGPDERLGLPATVVALTQGGRVPTTGDIVAAFDTKWTAGER